MANSLFEFTRQANPFSQIINDARALKSSFSGNPREEVQRLLNSGQMSQADFNRYSQIAQQVVQAVGEDF